MKQYRFDNEIQLNEFVNLQRIRLTLRNKTLLNFITYQVVSIPKKGLFLARLFFEYQRNNLQKEIDTRKMLGTDFSTEEMTLLIQHTINALAFLQHKNFVHGGLNPGLILIGKDQKFSHLFIVADNLRQLSRFPKSQIDQVIRNEPLFLSPEIFNDIKARDANALGKVNPFVADVFSLGLIFLCAGLLEDVTRVYQRTASVIDQQMLKKLVYQFKNRYSDNPYIGKVVETMLNPIPYSRPDFIQLYQSMAKIETISQFFENQRRNPNAQLT